MLTGAIIGCVVALVIMAMNKSKAKQGTGLPGQLEQAMREGTPQLKKVDFITYEVISTEPKP